ncbi:MAG TPA: hypothetical protein VK851_09745 [Anaerolineales bacterium]|nr:hypothetical protein [Anaerolineales bacterium]
MNLLDRYVAEVGKHLPRGQRADIEAEIRSTLEDMLEERDQASVEDDAAVISLLKEYGEPRKVAESYIGPRYLIGPRLYPTFELVVKIVTGVLLVVSLVGLGFGLAASSLTGPEFLSTIGDFFAGLLSGLIAAFGNIVIVFAILERVLPASEFEKKEGEWNPADLAKEPDPDAVKISDAIATIIFTFIGLAILNLYPNAIGLFFSTDGEWTFIPILSEAFFTYLPWINLLGVLQIVFNLYQLRQQTWTLFSRLVNIVIETGSIALAVVMLKGPSLVALDAGKFAGTPLADDAQVFVSVAQWIPTIVLTIVIIVGSIEVAQMVYRIIRGRTSTPYPVAN